MKAGTAIALLGALSAAQSVSANWFDYESKPIVANTETQCTSKESGGFDWSDLNYGTVPSSYNNYGWSGYTCKNKPNKRSLGLDKRTFYNFNSKCISADIVPETYSNTISCSKKFSIEHLDISVDIDTDVEFTYGMPDGSSCRQVSSCSKLGSKVQNTQCGGATSVKCRIHHKSSNQKKCGMNIHKINFHCNSGSSTSQIASSTIASYTIATSDVSTTEVSISTSSVALSTTESSVVYTTSVESTSTEESSTSVATSVETTSVETVSSVCNAYSCTVATTTSESSIETTPATTISAEGSTTSSETTVETTSESSTDVSTTSQESSICNAYSCLLVTSISATDVTTTATDVTTTATDITTTATDVTSTATDVTSTATDVTTSATDITTTSEVSSATDITTSSEQSTEATTTTSETTATDVTTSTSETTATDVTTSTSETTATDVTTSTTETSSTTSATTEEATTPMSYSVSSESTSQISETTTSTATFPASPIETVGCPSVLPQCLKSWLGQTKCQSTADVACMCPDSNYTNSVIACLEAYSTEQEMSSAVEYFQGLCAAHITVNPAIITGVPSYITLAPPAGAISTVTVATTMVVACTASAGVDTTAVGYTQSFTTSTIQSTITVPFVKLVSDSSTNAALVQATISQPAITYAAVSTVAATTTPSYSSGSYATASAASSAVYATSTASSNATTTGTPVFQGAGDIVSPMKTMVLAAAGIVAFALMA